MSTYYYLGCDKHKKRTASMIAVTRVAGDHLDNQEQLLSFMLNHVGCPLAVFSEYDDERFDYEKELEG